MISIHCEADMSGISANYSNKTDIDQIELLSFGCYWLWFVLDIISVLLSLLLEKNRDKSEWYSSFQNISIFLIYVEKFSEFILGLMSHRSRRGWGRLKEAGLWRMPHSGVGSSGSLAAGSFTCGRKICGLEQDSDTARVRCRRQADRKRLSWSLEAGGVTWQWVNHTDALR